MENLVSFIPSEIENRQVYGRCNFQEDGSLALFWTASGISVNVKSGELWAQVEGDYDNCEPWASVWINGVQVSRFMILKGVNWYCLFRGLSKEKINNITLLKETQAMSGDGKHLFVIKNLGIPEGNPALCSSDKTVFYPIEKKSLKIEFIGDSITTGEGLAGGVDEGDWITGWMATKGNYAVETAHELDADYSIVSQCGWGITSGWDNDRHCVLPKFYGQQAGILWGEKNESLGCSRPHDFASWQPDFVVVNLGTNDWGAFNSPAKADPETGAEWKYHLEADGKPNAADLKTVTDGVKAFAAQIRKNNPKAKIIWAYGMCSFDLGEDYRKAVEEYAEENADGNICFVKLPSMGEETEEERGSRGHPGIGTHSRVKKIIVEKIRSLM